MARKLALALFALVASEVSYAAPTAPVELKERAALAHGPPKPAKTLIPAVHWAKNRRDPSQLLPTKDGQLYFVGKEQKHVKNGKQDPYTDHDFADMKASFSSPTVMTEDSEFISDVSCTANSLTISISDKEAYTFAKKHWADKGIIFGVYAQGCGDYEAGVRSFWNSTGNPEFSPNSNGGVAQIAVSAIDSKKELASAGLEWGSYSAPTSGIAKRSTPTCAPPKKSNGLVSTDWCSADFDKVLDQKLGYMKLSEASFLSKLESAARSVTSAFPTPITKRDCGSESCSESLSVGGSFDIALPENTASPWGSAYELPNPFNGVTGDLGIDLYCVNCHVTGNVQFSGSVLIQILPDIVCDPGDFPPFTITCTTEREPGLYNMNVGTTGQIDANLAVGLKLDHFFHTFDKEWNLITYPLTPWSIPDILSLGPEVTLDIKLGVGAGGTGTVLAGAGATFGPWDASYDFDSQTASDSGLPFTPHSIFKATGQFDFNVSVTFPVGLGLGLDFPILRSAGITAIPSTYTVALKDGFGAIVDGKYTTFDASTPKTKCPGGLEWDIKLLNQVFIDVMGGEYIKYLSQWTSPSLIKGCIAPKDGSTIIQELKTPAKVVSAGKDGNLYISGNKTQFATNGDVVISDDENRFFHFYNDEMDKFGVSRLRLSSLNQVPKTAEMVALNGASSGKKGPTAYVAVDSKRQIYYPVVCNIKGKGQKVFLERKQGLFSKLVSPSLIWSVTGGVVQSCDNLYLTPPSH